jgi:hypothetical protein
MNTIKNNSSPPEVLISVRNVYGNHYIYPENATARIFLKIQSGRTLNLPTITQIRELGHPVAVSSHSGPSGTLEKLEAMGARIETPVRETKAS